MLDGPAFAADRLLGAGRFVCGEHFVDCRVADRVRGNAPSFAIQLLDDVGERRLLHRVHATERAALTPRLRVGFAHPPALEPAVDAELHAADAEPLIAFVGLHARCGDRPAHRPGAVGVEAHQLIDADGEDAAARHLLQQSVLLDRRAGIPDAGESRLVQLAVLRLQRLDGQLRRCRQGDERLRAIDQLTVQFTVLVARDASAGRLRRIFFYIPLRQRRRIENVLMSAADDHDRIVRRDAVQIVAIRQSLFLELRFVPVAVRHDDLARSALLHASFDRREHIRDRSRARQIDARSAAGVVQVTVCQPRNHRLAVQIDRRRVRPRELPDVGVRADGGEAAILDRDRLRDRKARVDRNHVAIDENRVGRRRLRVQQAGGDKEQQVARGF